MVASVSNDSAPRQPGDRDETIALGPITIAASSIQGLRKEQQDAFFAMETSPRSPAQAEAFLKDHFSKAASQIAQIVKEDARQTHALSKRALEGRLRQLAITLDFLKDKSLEKEKATLRSNIGRIEIKLALLNDDADEQHMKTAGTTATVGVLSPDDKLTVAHLGDSPVIVFALHRNGEMTAHKLTRDHTPDDPQERQICGLDDTAAPVDATIKTIDRKTGQAKTIESRRLVNSRGIPSVNMTRTLGDTHIPNISHDPEIKTYDLAAFKRSPDDRLFVCVASDGIYRTRSEYSDDLEAQDFIPVIRQSIEAGNQNDVASRMVDFAYNNGSTDNISVMFTELKPGRTSDVVLGLFDGHRTELAAKAASTLFKTAFGRQTGMGPFISRLGTPQSPVQR